MVTQNESKKRQAHLFGLGMAKRSFGFSFRGYYVDGYCIENMTPPDWENYFETIEKKISELKTEIDFKYTPTQQVLNYSKELLAVQIPIIPEGRLKDILDGYHYSLIQISQFIEEEVANA